MRFFGENKKFSSDKFFWKFCLVVFCEFWFFGAISFGLILWVVEGCGVFLVWVE